ncbi:MAG: hypothetical protein EBE86_010575 [Hormoscilla sp. GUM202]|nr:hypothetical protein [Hormoscilla sp. GUM202]
MQVKDMTVEEVKKLIRYQVEEELKRLIRYQVEEVLEEWLGDPDEGKEVKEEVKQQLIEMRRRRACGIPAEEVYKKLGINL